MPGSGQDRDNTTNLPGTTYTTQIDNAQNTYPTNSNDAAGTDTDGGYVGGSPNYDYQTTTAATLHNVAYVIGGATQYPRTAGLSTLAGGGSAEGYNPFSNIRF